MPTDQTHGTHSLATTRKLHDLTRSKAALLAENAKDGKKSGARGAAGVERNGTRWGHVWAQQRGMQGLAHDSCRAGRVRAGGLELTGSSTPTPDY